MIYDDWIQQPNNKDSKMFTDIVMDTDKINPMTTEDTHSCEQLNQNFQHQAYQIETDYRKSMPDLQRIMVSVKLI